MQYYFQWEFYVNKKQILGSVNHVSIVLPVVFGQTYNIRNLRFVGIEKLLHFFGVPLKENANALHVPGLVAGNDKAFNGGMKPSGQNGNKAPRQNILINLH